MKKMISILVTFAFVISAIGTAFPQAETTENEISVDVKENVELNHAEKRQVKEASLLFQEIGIDANSISVIGVRENLEILYNVDYGDGVNEELKIRTNENDDIILEVRNDTLHDVIKFKSDGSLYLDNEIVLFENISEKENLGTEEGDIEVASQHGRGSIYKTSPIKGKASDYTTKVKTIKNASVKTNKLIKKMTISAIAALIKKALQSSVPQTLPVTVVSTAAKHVKSASEAAAPTSKYLSYSLTKYAYKNNTTLDKYYKYTGNYYAKKNYEGKKCPHTFYEYNAIGL